MDKINHQLKEENICLKCHDIIYANINYDAHVRACKGGDQDVITTKFYVKGELILQRVKRRVVEISTQWLERPATR